MRPVRLLDAPPPAAALTRYLAGFSAKSARMGQAVVAENRITPVGSMETATLPLSAVVRISERVTHASTLDCRDSRVWSGSCSCNAPQCGHLYALGLFLSALLPEAPEPGKPAEPPAHDPEAFALRWAPVLTQRLGRRLTGPEIVRLKALALLFKDFKENGNVLQAPLLKRHGFAPPLADRAHPYTSLYDGLWSPPPKDPWAFWQVIALDYENRGRPVPDPFGALTDTTQLRVRQEALHRDAEIARWRSALEAAVLQAQALTPHAAPAARDAGATGLRLRLTEKGWHLEIQTEPGKPFRSPARTWLSGMRHRDLRDFTGLPQAQASLAGLVLLSMLRSYGRYPAGKGGADDALVASCFAMESARPAIVRPDGSPWRVEEGELFRRTVEDPSNPTLLRFELVDSAGNVHALSKPAATVPENLYVSGERVFRGPPALAEAVMPKFAAADPEIAHALGQLGVHLPASFAPKYRTVTLGPRIELRLEKPTYEDDPERISLRLTAHADSPPLSLAWSNRGWQWKRGGPLAATDADGFHLDLDQTRANAAGALLAELRPRWDEAIERWTCPIDADFLERLERWCARAGDTAEILASPAFRSAFLEAPTKAFYSLEISGTGTGVDWFDVRLKLNSGDTAFTADELEMLRRADGKFVHLPRRGWRRLSFGEQEGLSDKLAALGLDASAAGLDELQEPIRLHALHLADDRYRDAMPEVLFDRIRRRSEQLKAPERPASPAGLSGTMRPYQVEGFHFLAFLAANGFGGILADDMGLGKTLQALAWILWLHEGRSGGRAGEARPGVRALVVCPKSLVFNWQAEAERFAPGLRAMPLCRAAEGWSLPEGAQIVVASYAQLRLNEAVLTAVTWDAVILDEAQAIKNPGSITARAACRLPATHRLILTGTPIENRLLDLWSLFAFAMPGLLGGQTAFKRLYNDKNDPGAQSRLASRVRHFMLRRTKGQVARDLPPRTEEDIHCELEGEQAVLYQAELKRARQMLLDVKSERELGTRRFNILESLLRLRQICCDPRLLGAQGAGSAKMDALFDTIEPIVREGHKVLVFSQFVTMLRLIGEGLDERRIPFALLTGETEDRQALVNRFQGEPDLKVFLLSLKVGGSGLNLTAASYVILYDPWWNPAVEAQAIDRTHRIGQVNPVFAYRLLARNTIEEKIRALQNTKATLAAGVIQEESLATVMDLDTLRQVLL